MRDEKKCSKCGKVFFCYPEHVYRAGSKWYCSWTCYNHRHEGQTRKNVKRVEQYTLQGKFVREWGSTKEAAASVNLSPSAIGYACRGKQRTAGGFVWKYKE